MLKTFYVCLLCFVHRKNVNSIVEYKYRIFICIIKLINRFRCNKFFSSLNDLFVQQKKIRTFIFNLEFIEMILSTVLSNKKKLIEKKIVIRSSAPGTFVISFVNDVCLMLDDDVRSIKDRVMFFFIFWISKLVFFKDSFIVIDRSIDYVSALQIGIFIIIID